MLRMAVVSLPSAHMREANARLLALRQAHARAHSPRPCLSRPVEQGDSQQDYTLENGQALLCTYRARDRVQVSPPAVSTSAPAITFLPAQQKAGQGEKPAPATVKHYPAIGIATLEHNQAALYRVWLACRYLDYDGRGWLAVETMRDAFTEPGVPLRLFSWRRLRQVLTKGDGVFWRWDKDRGRLWLLGTARIAARLQVKRLTGTPVALPIATLTDGVGKFRAHLYAAYHSGRRHANPLSRHTQRELLSVPESTQRHYCRVARIPRQSNIAIGRRHSPEIAQERAYRHGTGYFSFLDKNGRLGRKYGRYVAWQLPTTHQAIHATAPSGRQKKINRTLSDLVILGAQGNGEQKAERLFHANGAEATKAFNRHPNHDSYWPWETVRGRTELWNVIEEL